MEYELSPLTIDPDELLRRSMAVRVPGLRKKRQPKYPELEGEDRSSLMGDILSKGTGTLQYLGETLDKPGRAVRGLLAGKPKELANLIPFSDTLGITKPDESVSGRDLLEKAGVLGQNTPGLDWGDVAGFGAEVLTDPLSYLGVGALTKAGKVARAAGISTKGANKFRTLGEHLATAAPDVVKAAENAAVKQGTTLGALQGQKLGGAFGFTTGPLGMLGIHGSHVPAAAQSETAKKVTESLGNVPGLLGKIPGVGPALQEGAEGLNRIRRGLFDHSVQGNFTKFGQQVAEYSTEAKRSARQRAIADSMEAADTVAGFNKAFQEAFGSRVGTLEQSEHGLRAAAQAAAETQQRSGKPAVAYALKRYFPGVPVGREMRDRFQNEVVNKLLGIEDRGAQAYIEKGGNLSLMPSLGDPLVSPGLVRHKARFLDTEAEIAKGGRAAGKARQFQTSFEGAMKRTPAFKFIPAHIKNQMLSDPEVFNALEQGTDVAMAMTLLDKKYGPWIRRATASHNHALTAAGQAATTQPIDVFNAIAAHLRSTLGQGKPGRLVEDAVQNTARYSKGLATADANLTAIHRLYGDNLVDWGIPLQDAFKQAGMTDKAIEHFGRTFGQQALSMTVHPSAVEAATSFMRKVSNPEWAPVIAQHIDDLTKLFKKHVTLPFPNFAVRNFYSGQAMNAMGAEINSASDAAKYGKSFRQMLGILENPTAHKEVLHEMVSRGVLDERELASLGVELGWGLGHIPNRAPGGIGVPLPSLEDVRQGVTAAREQAGPGLRGALGAALNVPANVGAKVNQRVEFANRVAPYLYLRQHLGWTPEAAAQRVRQLQVAYDELAPFEKAVMRRLVPFYTWQRKVIPEMLAQIGRRPGGVTAQTIRASNIGRSQNEFVPPYIGEGMSVNLGGDRYLSGLGLPTDQLADLAVKGPTTLGTLSRTGQKALAQTNPLLKMPLEIATGTNFFTGRPLTESYKFPTNNVLFNELTYNTPAARALTSGRQLLDERKSPATKAVNLLTGAKVTDVPGGLERQQRIAEAKILSELLREQPNMTSSVDVFPKHDQRTGEAAQLLPQEERLYRAFLGVKRAMQNEAKKRKKQHTAG